MTDISARLAAAVAGRYQVERELGVGGMATVYLAHDVRHDRHVALKLLRPELAVVIGAERFLSEIRTTANLQHPHILPLFDSGEADGFLYYVMPFIEGETVRDRLNREKQLPIPDALRIATEVAAALDYAHRRGIIHRDIKPENILLHDGSALVADFGIALAASKAGGTRMTETGMSLGTPYYMSPEQAMGEREITAKSDVYALGAVFYEMLSGEPPFTGPTAQAIVARALTDLPAPLIPKRHTIPPNVEAAVLKALEKLPADRFTTASEFAASLADETFASRSITFASVRGARAGRFRIYAGTAAGVVLGTVLGAIAMIGLSRPERAPVTRYSLALPEPARPANDALVVPSPDGSYLAWVGPGEGPGAVQLWVKRRDQLAPTPLAGTGGAAALDWSPTSQSIAYLAGGQLRKVSVAGGAVITLADTTAGASGVAWLDDGTIVYVRAGGNVFKRVSESGGPATDILGDSFPLRFPSALPGNKGLVYTRCGRDCSQSDGWVLDLATGETRQILPGATKMFYAETGHIITVRRDGAMLAVPFDPSSLKTRGPGVPVMDGVLVPNRLLPLFAVSRSGMLVVRPGSSLDLLVQHEMVWVDRSGGETPVDPSWKFRLTEYGANIGWALSPDGTRLAIGLNTDGGDDIWVKQLPRGPLSRVSYDSAAEYRPRWLAGGRSIMFGSNRFGLGNGGLYLHAADGTGVDSLVRRSPTGIFEAAWTPDRSWLVFRIGGVINQAGGRDVVGIRFASDSAPVPVIATPYDEEGIALSPDGKWIAYESNETGRTEVFLRPFPRTESGKWQISNGGGVAPLWAKNGRELFYVNTGRDMMAASVAPGVEPAIGARRTLFHMRDEWYLRPNEFYTPWDVAPDGRFIMARGVAPASSVNVPLVIVENWADELREKLGKP